MMTRVLAVAVVVEVVAVAGFLVAQLVHAIAGRGKARSRVRTERARAALIAAVVHDAFGAEVVEAVGALRPAERDRVLCSVAAQVRSHNDPTFATLASLVGADARIERDLRSLRWWVRRAALRRATVLGLAPALASDLLWDPDARVRAAAVAWTATVRRDADPAGALVPLLGDGDDRVRHAARTAIVGLGSAAQAAVLDAIDRGDPAQRSAVFEVAAALDDPLIAAAVRPLLDGPRHDLVPGAVLASVPALGPEDGPLIAALFDHPDPAIGRAALRAAGRAELVSVVPAVARHLHAPDGTSREVAIEALERLGPSGELLLRRAARETATHD